MFLNTNEVVGVHELPSAGQPGGRPAGRHRDDPGKPGCCGSLQPEVAIEAIIIMITSLIIIMITSLIIVMIISLILVMVGLTLCRIAYPPSRRAGRRQ